MSTNADNTPEMMDPSAAEDSTAAPIEYTPRDAYALGTLIYEVRALYSSVDVQTSEPNGRNVNLGVQFVVDSDETDLFDVLATLIGDERVAEVHQQNGVSVLVVLHNNSATQDNVEPFNISEVRQVILEGGDPETLLSEDNPDPEPERDLGDLDIGVDPEATPADEPEPAKKTGSRKGAKS